MNKIEIALACDERYVPGLIATASSILASADISSSFVIHILDGGIKKESVEQLSLILKKFRNQVDLNLIKIDTEAFKNLPAFFYESKMTYARLLLPDLLPVEKVIYIDTDILVLKDFSKLWQTELKTHAAVCIESVIGKIKNDCPVYKDLKLDGEAPYFNAGLMFINLQKFRDDKIADKTFDYLRQYHDYCKFWDQSALNVTLYNKLTWLDNSWNIQAHKEAYNPVTDLHFFESFDINFHFVTSYKPWLSFSTQPEYEMFYILLNEVGYKLNQQVFLNSKNLYLRKQKMLSLLPLYYNVYGTLHSIAGKRNKAATLSKVADHWQYALRVNKDLKLKKNEIDKLKNDWANIIRSKMINV